MIFNKKGSTDVLAPVIIFLILNLIFFSLLLYFVFKQATGAVVYEELYAKKISLLVDNARCNSEIILNVSDLEDVLKKNDFELSSVFGVNSKTNEIVVRVAERGGYAYKYFSDCDLEFEIVDTSLVLKIEREKKDE